MSDAHDALILAYLGDVAAPEEVDRLEEVLRRDPAARRRYAELAGQDVVLGEVLALTTRSPAGTSPLRRRRHGSARRRLRRWWRGPTLAGALVAAGLVLALLPQQPSAPAARTVAELVRGTVQEPLAPLLAGTEVLATQQGARLRLLDDGSLIDLTPGSRVVLGASRGTALTVQEGMIWCTVRPSAGAAFALMTPQAQVRVLGTEFVVAVAADRSTVAVEAGRVTVRTAAAAQVLAATERCAATANGWAPAQDRPLRCTLVQGGSGTPVPLPTPLDDGAEIPAALFGVAGANVLIEVGDAVRSVRSWLDGRPTRAPLERHWPFYAFGNTGAEVHGEVLAPGEHELRIQAYADAAGTQELGSALHLNFRVMP